MEDLNRFYMAGGVPSNGQVTGVRVADLQGEVAAGSVLPLFDIGEDEMLLAIGVTTESAQGDSDLTVTLTANSDATTATVDAPADTVGKVVLTTRPTGGATGVGGYTVSGAFSDAVSKVDMTVWAVVANIKSPLTRV